jgi:hypothetical protein
MVMLGSTGTLAWAVFATAKQSRLTGGLQSRIDKGVCAIQTRRKSICFFFAMWYLASRNEFALDGTVYSRLQKSPRFREVTIRDNSASEVKS